MFLLYLLLASASSLAAQTDWTALKTLTPSDRVTVEDLKSRYTAGRFQEWTEAEIRLLRKEKSIALPRGQVKRVWVDRKGKRWKSALIGLGVGFAIGFAIGARTAGHLTDRNDPSFNERVGMGSGFGLVIGGVGAGIGALAGGTDRVTVYRSP